MGTLHSKTFCQPVARWLTTLALVLGSALIAGPNVVAPTPAAAAADPAAVVVPERYLTQTVDWQPCYFDELLRFFYPKAPHTYCASVVVPMDWRHPDDHPDITLPVAHSQATGTSQGLLVANPGGPGLGALDFTSFLAADKPRMFRDFDLLGFDPRGFDSRDDDVSERLRCVASQQDYDALPSVNDPRVRGPRAHAAELAYAKLTAKACAAEEFARFVGTQQTVYDLEFLRRLVGQDRPVFDKLHYVGYSYGTWLGSWYADTYPEHTGRFVLDSNMNWTASMAANQAGDPKSFERRRDQMFFPWVARHNRLYGLGKTTAKVKKAYEKTRARIARDWKRGYAELSPSDFDYTIATQLYDDQGFLDAVATMLQFYPSGKKATAADSHRRVRAAAEDQGYELDPSQVVRCNDSAWSRNLTMLLKRADSDAVKYPFIGYGNTVSMCSYWPYAPQTRTIDLAGAPMMLMLQSEGDPATAYEGALAAHRATAQHTRLVSVADEGQHGLYIGGPSTCAEKITDTFLFSGQLPAKDKVCSTSPLPGDKKVYKLKGAVAGAGVQAASSAEQAKPVNRRLAQIRETAARLERSRP